MCVRQLPRTPSCYRERPDAFDGLHPEVQHLAAEMTVELEAMSAHVSRIAEDWSNGVDHGLAWGLKLLGAQAPRHGVGQARGGYGDDDVWRHWHVQTQRARALVSRRPLRRLSPANPLLAHEFIGKMAFGIDIAEQPRWGLSATSVAPEIVAVAVEQHPDSDALIYTEKHWFAAKSRRCPGSVGMMGTSHLGATQLLLAERAAIERIAGHRAEHYGVQVLRRLDVFRGERSSSASCCSGPPRQAPANPIERPASSEYDKVFAGSTLPKTIRTLHPGSSGRPNRPDPWPRSRPRHPLPSASRPCRGPRAREHRGLVDLTGSGPRWLARSRGCNYRTAEGLPAGW